MLGPGNTKLRSAHGTGKIPNRKTTEEGENKLRKQIEGRQQQSKETRNQRNAMSTKYQKHPKVLKHPFSSLIVPNYWFRNLGMFMLLMI